MKPSNSLVLDRPTIAPHRFEEGPLDIVDAIYKYDFQKPMALVLVNKDLGLFAANSESLPPDGTVFLGLACFLTYQDAEAYTLTSKTGIPGTIVFKTREEALELAKTKPSLDGILVYGEDPSILLDYQYVK